MPVTIKLWGDRYEINNTRWTGGDPQNREYLKTVTTHLDGAAIMGPDIDHAIARNVIKEIGTGEIVEYDKPEDVPGDNVIV